MSACRTLRRALIQTPATISSRSGLCVDQHVVHPTKYRRDRLLRFGEASELDSDSDAPVEHSCRTFGLAFESRAIETLALEAFAPSA